MSTRSSRSRTRRKRKVVEVEHVDGDSSDSDSESGELVVLPTAARSSSGSDSHIESTAIVARQRKRQRVEAEQKLKEAVPSTAAAAAGGDPIGTAGELLQDIRTAFPGREEQIRQLLLLTGEAEEECEPVYVFGHAGTGKTAVLKALLAYWKRLAAEQEVEARFAYVNCNQTYTVRLMLERIMAQVHTTDREPWMGHCGTMNAFVTQLSAYLQQHACTGTTYLVFDNAERLRSHRDSVLSSLMRLHELTGANVCVLLSSRIDWHDMHRGSALLEPFTVHFPEYPLEVLQTILQREHTPMLRTLLSKHSDAQRQCVMDSFMSMLTQVFHGICRDLTELTYLTRLLLPVYVEPVQRGAAAPGDAGALYSHMHPYMRQVLDRIYLREFTLTEWTQYRKASHKSDQLKKLQAAGSKLEFELPFHAKFLLLASYLASYNPAKLDRQYFSSAMGDRLAKQKRRRGGAAAKGDRIEQELLGPKQFPLERMIAIYHAILDETPQADTAEVYFQINTLQSLGFLSRMSNANNLEQVKLRCNVNKDFIRSVARNVNFELDAFLYRWLR